MAKIDIIPKFFKLQWHITERCNFRCSHCYQENYDTSEMSLGQMEEVLKQFVALLKKWEIPSRRAELTITGGEPFLHKDFFKLLAQIYKYSANYEWYILSNGSLLNRENVKTLKMFKIGDCQISLEGLEENNDKIRGKGSFGKVFGAIKILTERGIHTSVSLTMTKENIGDLLPLADLLAKSGVNEFRVRRLVPWGRGSQLIDSLLKPQELLAVYRKLEEAGGDFSRKGLNFKISKWCENGFLWTDQSRAAYCAINNGEILALLPNGDILPCRHLPIKIGNIFENSLEDIFYCDKIKEMRDINKMPGYCRKYCSKFNNCFGGAKCVTYTSSGRLDIPDVQCPFENKIVAYLEKLKGRIYDATTEDRYYPQIF